MEYYQDSWVKGKVIKKGIRDCEERYQMIKPFFERYNRPITVLDLGANFGYFSFRLAEDFPGVYVIVEAGQEESVYLKELCEKNDNKNVIFWNHRINLGELNYLSNREQFDVILAFNSIHHFMEPYNEVLKILNKMTDFIFLEHPSPNESETCNIERVQNESLDFSIFEHHETIGKTLCHTTEYKTSRDLKFIQTNISSIRHIEMLSNFNDKIALFKDKCQSSEWVNGINFNHFLRFNGIYPNNDYIIDMLNYCEVEGGGDIEPWNLVMTGNSIELIDSKDYRTYVSSWYRPGDIVDITTDLKVDCAKINIFEVSAVSRFAVLKNLFIKDKLEWDKGIKDHL